MTFNQLKKTLCTVLAVQSHLKEHHFIACFGKDLGEHLWDKFSKKLSHQMLRLWQELDADNRDLFLAYLVKLK